MFTHPAILFPRNRESGHGQTFKVCLERECPRGSYDGEEDKNEIVRFELFATKKIMKMKVIPIATKKESGREPN